jgi:hypothetical protein
MKLKKIMHSGIVIFLFLDDLQINNRLSN